MRKVGDRIEPDRETLWIVIEAEERALRGEDFKSIARWTQDIHPEAWSSPSGVSRALKNTAYVAAGTRTPERQHALNELLAVHATRFGQRRINENEFTGVFVCGHCEESGRTLMMSASWKHDARGKGYQYPFVVCSSYSMPNVPTHHFSVTQSRFESQWWQYVERLHADPAVLARWASAVNASDGVDRRRQLNARLAEIDQRSAALKARRDHALDLFSDKSQAVKRQARKALEETERDEMELAITRQTVLAELTTAPTNERDAKVMCDLLYRYRELYEGASVRTRNELNRALCAALGSHPRLYRQSRYDDPIVDWPELDALRLPARR